MRISDWSSDVCSSDLLVGAVPGIAGERIKRLVEIVVIGVDPEPVGGERKLADRLPLRGCRIGQSFALLLEIAGAERVREPRAGIAGARRRARIDAKIGRASSRARGGQLG